MRRPAVLTFSALPRRLTELLPERDVRQPLERGREGAAVGRGVEQPLALMTDEAADSAHCRSHDRKPRRHVFEDLQRRPEKPEFERAMTIDVEWGNTDVAGRKRRGEQVVRQRASERHAPYPVRRLTDAGQFRPVADEHCADVATAALL